MRKISQQTFSLPLPTKSLKIMGLRVETSQSPLVEIMDAKLTVKDNWKIQLAYTPLREKD